MTQCTHAMPIIKCFYLLQLMAHVNQFVIILKIIILIINDDAVKRLQIIPHTTNSISDVSQLLQLMQSGLSFILETFPLPAQS